MPTWEDLTSSRPFPLPAALVGFAGSAFLNFGNGFPTDVWALKLHFWFFPPKLSLICTHFVLLVKKFPAANHISGRIIPLCFQ